MRIDTYMCWSTLSRALFTKHENIYNVLAGIQILPFQHYSSYLFLHRPPHKAKRLLNEELSADIRQIILLKWWKFHFIDIKRYHCYRETKKRGGGERKKVRTHRCRDWTHHYLRNCNWSTFTSPPKSLQNTTTFFLLLKMVVKAGVWVRMTWLVLRSNKVISVNW